MPETPWDRRELLKAISAGAAAGFLAGGRTMPRHSRSNGRKAPNLPSSRRLPSRVGSQPEKT